MALSLPDLTFLNKQLGTLGQAVKAAGPSLFSSSQSAGPSGSRRNSMMSDWMDTRVLPQNEWKAGLTQSPTGFGIPEKEWSPATSNPYYNPGQSGSTGSGTGLGGDWTGVDQWSSTIDAAAAQYGLDPNMIKAVMKLESGGDPNASGAVGVWGPMQVNSNAWGDGAWMNDPNANIFKGAEILKHYMDANGGDFREALRAYHGYGSDGYTTDQQYADTVMQNYQQLQQGGTGSGSGGAGFQSMFGTSAVPDWGEFGVQSDNGYYGYGSGYGMNGTQHTGVDVPMPVGSAYRAPMGGVVTCGGTGNGAGTDGAGCSAFGDYFGNGAGRVEVLLDNGAVLIFGHSSTSALQPGQRFNVGDVLGTSGGMNSAHVHLEARVRDSSTPSGWRIVDPRTVVGSGSGVFGGGSQQTGGTQSMARMIADFYARQR